MKGRAKGADTSRESPFAAEIEVQMIRILIVAATIAFCLLVVKQYGY